MRKTGHEPIDDFELEPEYRVDYSKTTANRFAAFATGEQRVVTLDPDVGSVFTTSEAVNTVLRALIASMPVSRVKPKRPIKGVTNESSPKSRSK